MGEFRFDRIITEYGTENTRPENKPGGHETRKAGLKATDFVDPVIDGRQGAVAEEIGDHSLIICGRCMDPECRRAGRP